jgi:hypothetical protein
VFMAELERRRAEARRQPQERLRSLLSKAVENIGLTVESGDFKASIELLKAMGMYGNGMMNAIFEQDPEKLIRRQAEPQVAREGTPKKPWRSWARTWIRLPIAPGWRRWKRRSGCRISTTNISVSIRPL